LRSFFVESSLRCKSLVTGVQPPDDALSHSSSKTPLTVTPVTPLLLRQSTPKLWCSANPNSSFKSDLMTTDFVKISAGLDHFNANLVKTNLHPKFRPSQFVKYPAVKLTLDSEMTNPCISNPCNEETVDSGLHVHRDCAKQRAEQKSAETEILLPFSHLQHLPSHNLSSGPPPESGVQPSQFDSENCREADTSVRTPTHVDEEGMDEALHMLRCLCVRDSD